MNEVFNDHTIFILEEGVRFLPVERRITNDTGATVDLSENSYRFLSLLLNGEMDKQNIIELVWSEQRGLVSDSSYYGQIYILRKALELVGLPGTLIKTIPRKGVKYMGFVSQQPSVTEKEEAIDKALPGVTEPEVPEHTEVKAAIIDSPSSDELPITRALSNEHPAETPKSAVFSSQEWLHSKRWNQLITVLAVLAVCWLTTLAFAIVYFTMN